MPITTGSSLATPWHDDHTMRYVPFCETSVDGHKTPTAKSCHAGENESFENTMVVAATYFQPRTFLTFFALPLSTCDKAITSPEHNFRGFKLSGWMIMRFALRDSPSAASDKETVNLGVDICFVEVIEDWTRTCMSQ